MMFSVEFALEALEDLDHMYLYIADQGFPSNALAFTDKVFDYCGTLQATPHIGLARFDVSPGLRILGFRGQAKICFEVDDRKRIVTVLRILGRGQSVERAFATD